MSEANTNDVVASYQRCRADERFIDTFYELFLGMSPEVAQKFEHTDFDRQKLMLRESLLEMLSYNRGLPGSEKEIDKLAKRHRELNVTAEMYTMWLEALCAAVKQHDSEYSPEVGLLWQQAMQKGIDRMRSS